ncbi:cation:proton antiporter family protein [Actinomyces sp.]|uniref:cation:proton antiporter family protein n=1 Tax=Actinomyces sp. TaxID=29317 RepID=UPI0026DB9AE3|nr:cation:proton antiporter family protein [Actinomyces sp.]MDO4900413.1 cation:proton antiporter [Actinomyces sp.]
MTAAAAYLLTVVLLGFAAALLRLPPLVGYIAAGFLLGATDLPQLEWISTVGDLGAALLLFSIGLDLHPRSLSRRVISGTAAITMVALTALNALVIGLLVIVVGVSVGHTDGWGAALVLGFALASSSTIVIMKILEERDDGSAHYGRIAVGTSILQDTVSIVLLIFISGRAPSPWALTLVLLWPAKHLAGWVLTRISHREMYTLFGITVALLPGYELFEIVGLPGTLGSLVVGALLAQHTSALDLAESFRPVQELFLVAFFVSVGASGLPGTGALVMGLALLALVPLRSAIYTAVLWTMRLRHRSSVLTGLAVGSYSELALVVAGVGVSQGILGSEWLQALSIGVAGSFVLVSVVNQRAGRLVQAISHALPDHRADALHPAEAPVDLSGVEVVVFGMGRVGRSTYRRLVSRIPRRDENAPSPVLGVDSDADKVERLAAMGINIIEGDATDTDFWLRLGAGEARTAVLAMAEPGANLKVLDWIERHNFAGEVVAVARFDDEAIEMHQRGVDTIINVYQGVGAALADAVTIPPGPVSAGLGERP